MTLSVGRSKDKEDSGMGISLQCLAIAGGRRWRKQMALASRDRTVVRINGAKALGIEDRL